MVVSEITLEELMRKRVEVRAILGNTTHDIKNKVMEYQNSPDSKTKHLIYEAVETAFTVIEAVREHQNRYITDRFSPEFNLIFASYVGAGVGLDKLPGIESKINSENTRYFRNTSIDFSRVYPNPRNAMLHNYSEALEINSGSLKDLTADFFYWIEEEAIKAKEDSRFFPFYGFLEKNPVKVGELVFKNFKSPNHNAGSYTKKLSWDDIAGYDGVKEMFRGYCRILKNLDYCLKYQPMSELLPKGILLIGPPGTGKTTLAKILGDQADVPFESFGAADFGSSYVNQTAINLQKIFDQAAYPIKKGIAPASILFIDELDAIGRVRGDRDIEGAKTVTTMCVNMNGHKAVDGVVVIGATNRPDVIDPALTRAGRFDEIIEMGYPKERELEGIYKAHIDKRNRHSSNGEVLVGISIDKLVELSKDYTGADVNYIITGALRRAVLFSIGKGNNPRVSTQDLIKEVELYNSSPRKWS